MIANHIDKKPTQRHIIVDSLDLDIPVLISNGLGKFKTKVESAKLWWIKYYKVLIYYYE